MVWCLTAADSSCPGPFYFTAPGIYTVGRKDRTITIQTDKTISRLHAEISVEAAPLLGPAEKNSRILPRCRISLKDLSKFGTFVNKDSDCRPLNSRLDSTAVLEEADVIIFGTNNAVFRLQYVHMVLCMSPSPSQVSKDVISSVEAMGAYVFNQWNSQCTHLLVKEDSAVTDLVIAAVLSKKPVLSLEWLQALTSQPSPTHQLPSPSRYAPTLKISSRGIALPVTIVEPLARERTLSGCTVLMEKGGLDTRRLDARYFAHQDYIESYRHHSWSVKLTGNQLWMQYQCHDLPSLVSAGGGVVKLFTRDNLKDVAGLVQQHGLLLFPAGQASRKEWLGSSVLPSVQHLHQMSEEDLLRSILTSKLDLYSINLSPSASVDTDETVDEEDPQVEVDSASLIPQEIGQVAELRSLQEALVSNKKEPIVPQQPSADFQTTSLQKLQPNNSCKYLENTTVAHSTLRDSLSKELARSQAVSETFIKQPQNLTGAEYPVKPLPKSEQILVPSNESVAEVIFNGGLVVRKDWNTLAAETLEGAVLNFKSFKKGVAAYGNSFGSLVPFAKDPYRESDYGREMRDYVKQEEKRKEAELLAEDLFNTEQLKRRRVTAAAAAKGGALTPMSRQVI